MTEHELCYESDCQECCGHDEHDHGICLDCGKDTNEDLRGKADSLYDAWKDGE